MSQELDSLSIKISADASKAVSSINKLVRSINELSTAVSDVDISNISNLSKVLGKTANSLASISAQKGAVTTLKDVGKALNSIANNSKNLDVVAEALGKMNDASRSVKEEVANVGNTIRDSFQPPAVIGQMTTALSTVVRPLSQVQQGANDVQSTMQSIDFSPLTEGIRQATLILGLFLSKIFELDTTLGGRGIAGLIGTTATQPIGIPDNIIIDVDFSELEGAKAQVNSVTDAVDGLRNSISLIRDENARIRDVSERFEDVKKPLQSASDNVGKFKDALSGLKLTVKTDSLKSIEKQIKETESRYLELKKIIEENVANAGSGLVDSNTYENDVARLEGLRNEYDRLIQKKKELESHGGYKINAPNWGELKKGLDGVISTMDKASSKIKSFTSNIIGALSTAIGTIKRFTNSLFNVKRGTESASKGLRKVARSNDITLKSLTRTAKMLRLMIIRKILQAIIKNAITGFNNVAQYSEKMNASVSLLWNSLKQLGNAVGSMVSPLINAFAPAINRIIQLLIQAVNWVNQLVSALTGAKTWLKAKTLSDNYANSLESAKKNAEKLKKSVLGFDELNQLKKKDDTTTPVSEMFETKEIDNNISELSKKIQELWDGFIDPVKKAWNNICSFIEDSFKGTARKLKQLFETIAKDWLKVWNQPKTQRIIEKVLEIFGRIIRLVGVLADKFREAWNYNNNGKRFLEGIRDVLYTVVDWIDKAVESTESWANHLNLKPLFSSITDYLGSIQPVIDNVMGVLYDFYTSVLLPLAKWTLENGLPQFIDILKKFNDEVDWDGIRSSLQNLWNAIEPFAEKVGQGLLEFFDYLMGKVSELLNSNLLDTVINSISNFFTFLDNLEFDIDFSRLDSAFSEFLTSLEPVVDSVEKILEDFVSDFLKPLGEWTLGEGLPAFLEMVTNLNNLGLFENIRQAFKDLWEILEPFAEKVAEGLVVFIGDVGESLNNFLMSDNWESFIDSLKDWVNNVDADDIARNLKNIAGSLLIFEGLKGTLKIISGVGGSIKGLMNAVKFVEANAGALQVLTGIGLIISGLVLSLVSFVDMWKKGWSIIKTILEALGIALVAIGAILLGAPALVAGIVAGIVFLVSQLAIIIHDNWDSIKEWFVEAFDKIHEKWNSAIEWFSSGINKIHEFFTNTINKIRSLWSGFKTWISTSIINPVVSAWHTATTSIGKFFSDLWSGIKTGVKVAMNSVISIVEGMINRVITGINKFLSGIDKIATKVGEVFDKDWGGIAQLNKISLPRFATGGFPEDGLFMANHGELVGQFSNGKTAVANNEQIVDGIKQGVYEAVAMALSTNGSGGNASYINNTIQIDGETIARAVTKGQKSLDRRYNPSMA